VTLLGDLHDLGIGFVSLGEGIDLGTPAGRLQLHILAALAEFERCRIQERVKAGLARVKAEGRRLGRPTQAPPWEKLAVVAGRSGTRLGRCESRDRRCSGGGARRPASTCPNKPRRNLPESYRESRRAS
jgi:hypothetical protein